MTVTLNGVPADLRVPLVSVEFSSKNAQQGLAEKPYRALIIGPRDPATATAAVLEPKLITSSEEARAQFGPGSILSRMIAAWRERNRFTELWAVAVDDTGWTSAGRLMTIAGPATASGNLYFYVGGVRMVIPVTSGNTGTQVATALKTRIDNNPDIPVTCSAIGGTDNAATFTLTAKGGGFLGASIILAANHGETEEYPTGILISPAVYNGLAAGSGLPELNEVWSAIGDRQFDVMVQPWTGAQQLADTDTELARRWEPLNQIDGVAITAQGDDAAGSIALGQTLNSQHLTVLSSYRSPTPSYEWAAQAGAVVALEAAQDPARPFQRLELPGLIAPNPPDVPPVETRQLMLTNGIATTTVSDTGTVRIERLITTYQTDEFGIASTAYYDLNTVLTLSFLRWSVVNRVMAKYPRHKLADDGTRFEAGQQIVTPRLLKAELVALFTLWEAQGLVEGVEQFKRDLIVERDAQDPTRVNVILPPNLVNQLRILGAQIAFLL